MSGETASCGERRPRRDPPAGEGATREGASAELRVVAPDLELPIVPPDLIVGLLVLGVLDNGLDHIDIDNFLRILIRGLILLAALIVNVYAQRLREAR
jgi:hypothetical protein